MSNTFNAMEVTITYIADIGTNTSCILSYESSAAKIKSFVCHVQ